MSTEAQIDANRRNAQHSTGPVTESGKFCSSRNHLTLGLYTRQDYVKPEERDFYKEFCETMFAELNPASLLEQTLASEITGASWRLRRCSAAEAELADYAEQDPLLDESKDKTRRSIDRARASAHSIFHRCLNQLRKLRKEEAEEKLMLEKQSFRLAQHAEKETMDALDTTLSGIMNCPPPDWDALDREIAAEHAADIEEALRAKPVPFPADDDPELGSICKKTPLSPLAATIIKRNAACECKSGLIYRECCGAGEPHWSTLVPGSGEKAA
jgi:hypothetical protein